MKTEILEKSPFSLVLSGGGALGIAHLGVIDDMEEKGLRPSEIVGTSMGGIIGACLSIGMREAEIYEHIAAFVKVSNWIKFSLSGNAIVENDKIAEIFNRIFGKRTLKETQIPLKLVATDLLTGEKRVFASMDDIYIKDGILATMAIPGIFEEHMIDGVPYGDGFLCENLALSEATYDTVLAVDVLGSGSFEKRLPDNFFKTHNVLEMFERSMRLLIYNQTKLIRQSIDKKIILIEPKTQEYATYQFHKYDEIRALGKGLL